MNFPSPASVPVVFIQDGPCPGLPFALAQARHTNPGREQILMADASWQQEPEVSFEPSEGFDPLLQQFEKTFEARFAGALPDTRERLRRWFQLRRLMHQRGLTRAFVLESDAILDQDLGALSPACERWELALCIPPAGSGDASTTHAPFSFWSRRAIEGFCHFLLAELHGEALRERRERYAAGQRARGQAPVLGESVALYLFWEHSREERPEAFINLLENRVRSQAEQRGHEAGLAGQAIGHATPTISPHRFTRIAILPPLPQSAS